MSEVVIDNYLDWEVFATKPNWMPTPKDKLERPYALLSDFGTTTDYSSVDTAREVLRFEYLFCSKEEIADMRDYFDSKIGRLRAFWIPSWRSDIVVNTAFGSGDTSIFIDDIKYAEYFLNNVGAGRYLMFLFPDLTRKYAKVVGAPADNHIILDAPLGKAATTADLNYLMVSFLYLARFDSDDIRFDYRTNQVATTALVFRSIFNEAITSTTSTTTTTSSTTSTTSTSTTSTTTTTV